MRYFKIIFMLFIVNNIQLIHSTYYHSNWTRGIPDLPYTMGGMAIGYDSSNHAFVLVDRYRIVSYSIDENNFIVHNETVPIEHKFYEQGYTQIGNILYFLRNTLAGGYNFWQYIDSLTLDTKEYTSELFQYEEYDLIGGCLCSNNEYIIISGGEDDFSYEMVDRVEIYSISEGVWLSNVPSMNYARRGHSCIVYDNTVWMFGGQTCGKIDKLYIGNGINSESSWVTIRDALSTDGKGSRAVIYDQKIYIINPGTSVDVLDPLTNQITSFIPLLFSEEHDSVGAIARDNKMYAFGGRGMEEHHLDKWQYIEFLQTTTTTTPTPITKNCDCIGGMVSVTVKYVGECNADITGYYDKRNRVDEIFCVFDGINPGDYITCTASPNFDVFKSSLHFDIDCTDDRRRLGKKSSSDSLSADEKKKKDYCTAKLDTSCYVNIIGTQSKKCKDLKVVEYISGDGAICDETVSYNAALNDEIHDHENNDPLNTNTDQNSSVPIGTIIIIPVVILFIIILAIAAYCICIRSKKLNSNDVPNTEENETRATLKKISIDNVQEFE